MGGSGRELTGVGKYTYLEAKDCHPLPNGVYSAGRGAIHMIGIEWVLFFSVLVKDGKPYYIEIATCGDEQWDGRESVLEFMECK